MFTPSSKSSLDRRCTSPASEAASERRFANPKAADRAGVDRPPHRFRIGEGEVGGRERLDILVGEELDLGARRFIQAVRILDHRERAFGGEQIGLLDVVEGRLFAPGGILEAAVAAFRLDRRRGFRTDGARGGRGPELHPVGGGFLLRLQQFERVRHQMRGKGAEGARRRCRIVGEGHVRVERAGRGRAHQLERVGDDAGPGIGKLGRIGRIGRNLEHARIFHGRFLRHQASASLQRASSSSTAPQSRGLTKRKSIAALGFRVAHPASGSAGSFAGKDARAAAGAAKLVKISASATSAAEPASKVILYSSCGGDIPLS
jgi:hypothetical protein